MSRLSKSPDHDATISRSESDDDVVAVVFVSRTSLEKSDCTCFCEWHEQSRINDKRTKVRIIPKS